MSKRQMVKAVVAIALMSGLQLAAAAPANAVKQLSKADVKFTGGSSMTLFGAKPAVDNVSLGSRFNPKNDAASAVPEPAGWLMMLVGFGLLGIMTRRRAPTPAEVQQGI